MAESPAELERVLADLPTVGQLIKDRPYRQVWRFEFAGKPYYLKFYPRTGGKLKRLFRGSPAFREFRNLQAMQRAGVPSPRAVSYLAGFHLQGVKGDAVILEGIEPATPLDQHLNDLALRAERSSNHRDLVRQVIDIVQKLGKAKLGHSDLHLGNILLHEGKLYLIDGYSLHHRGMRTRDVLQLGQSVSRFATRGDLLRAWRIFTDAPLPSINETRKRQWRKLLEPAYGENRYFGLIADGRWSGYFFKHAKFPRRWAPASSIEVSAEDWNREWPRLLERVDRDELEVLKRTRSGDVLAGDITLGGRTVSVIVKRSKRRKWRRYITEIPRGGRARRAWRKAWSLVARDIPTGWPLLLIERRHFGYVTDGLIVFERVAATMLIHFDLAKLAGANRRHLFHRLGRTLRLLEEQGLAQYDSKMTNWMIVDDAILGPVPVVIDVDGIRKRTPPQFAIDRLLRSLREHPEYTPQDSKWVCMGYAPYAVLMEETGPHQQEGEEDDDSLDEDLTPRPLPQREREPAE